MQPDDALQALLETGRQHGYLTYAQVNDSLPEGVSGEAVDELLRLLEDQGIELIDEAELRQREWDQEQADVESDEPAEDFIPPGPWPPAGPAAPLTPPLPPASPANLSAGRPWPPGDPAMQQAFFEAILNDPANDAPRLVYADWLEEQGDAACIARAEFIRVQCALARLGEDDPRRADFEEREHDLLAIHEQSWLGPFLGLLGDLVRDWDRNSRDFLRDWRFERGFFTVEVYTPEDVLDLAPVLFESGLPIVVGIRNMGGCLMPKWERWPQFVESPHLGRITRVRSFDMDGGGCVMGETVATSPHLRSLACLDLVEEHIWPDLVRALGQHEPLGRLPSLRLKLTRNYLGDEALQAIAEATSFRCLTELEIGDAQNDASVSAAGVEALAAAPHLSRLRRLAISCAHVGVDGLRALLCSPHLTGLEELALTHSESLMRGDALAALSDLDGLPRMASLDLRCCRLGDEAAAALANSRWLSRLTTLRLNNEGIGDVGAVTLAASPHLGRLTALDLSNDEYGVSWGINQVGSKGLEALLCSAKLSSLARLDLGGHRITAEALDECIEGAGPPRLTALYLQGNRLRTEGARALAASECLARLEVLDLTGNGIGDEGTAALAASPHLGRLRVLRLGRNRLHARGTWSLAASPQLASLAWLALEDTPLGDAGARLLATSPYLRDLRTLSLAAAQIGPDGARALAAAPSFSRLLRLDLSNNAIGSEGACALAASPYLTRLSELHLDGNGVGPEGLLALARSPYLTRLTVLTLGDNELGPSCLEVLRDAPTFGRLTRLTLGGNELPDRWPTILQALVRSSALARLNRIEI